MSPANENGTAMRSSCFGILILACCLAIAFPSRAAQPDDSGDIIVTNLRGEVRVTMRAEPRAVRAGTILELPATIRTGADGWIELRQGATTVALAPRTELDIPAPIEPGAAIGRLVQPRGSAFYDVGKRTARKLRVETPYLVAVIKGTQFNVAVQDDSTTISLFEGRLEVRAIDDSDVVDLNAREIAIRHATDRTIRVLRMDSGTPGAPAPDAERSEGAPRLVPPRPDDGSPAAPRAPAPIDDLDRLITGSDAGVAVEPVSGASAADIGIVGSVEPGSETVSVGVDGGPVGADAGLNAGVDLGSGSVDVGASAGVDAGPVGVDAGLNAGVDAGAGSVDAGVDASVGLGGVSADLGLDAGLDPAGEGVAVAADAGVAVGPATVDAGLDPATGVADAGVDASLGSTDVGASLDVGSGGADLGLDVGLGAADVGLDVGLGGAAPADGTTADTGGSGGLLGGLLGRP